MHKDLNYFFEGAKALVISRVNNIFKRDGNLKVNVILAAKFNALENGDMFGEIKFFITKNAIILPSKDPTAWFNIKVVA